MYIKLLPQSHLGTWYAIMPPTSQQNSNLIDFAKFVCSKNKINLKECV
ncbi:hypothetical protein BAC_B0108 (plasmid) [Bacillus anthracis str. A0488]|nr:hypothetical protein BAMEG_B0029 [Bacillus anthracis str. CDC 684]ACQ45878.1 hypothetical protein BAA_B0031 [Bacillus anthracis str. A0248]AFH87097.1 Hypothetical Protein H9401_5712 [Bacillus anthracis str. H9401]AHK41858.1 hypothetical protein BAPAT_pXO20034 [Bacillus anthracis str. SVA11]EDR16257.1 hypothetical protein BAC_B0108 [Bacillus anthracis str. A0488]EDR85164.1 hypothetical protein BAQ_B0119 [Bacillus anthracis str. A0193]EDR90430.1 hypothetical protein BAH_B0064 [Bacillus anthr